MTLADRLHYLGAVIAERLRMLHRFIGASLPGTYPIAADSMLQLPNNSVRALQVLLELLRVDEVLGVAAFLGTMPASWGAPSRSPGARGNTRPAP